MLAVTAPGVLFVVLITAASLGLIASLLSGPPRVVTRSIRASARSASDGDASGFGPPVPTPGATQEPRDR